MKLHYWSYLAILVACMVMAMPLSVSAQKTKTDWGSNPVPLKKDTLKTVTDSLLLTSKAEPKEEGLTIQQVVLADTTATIIQDTLSIKKKKDWNTWRPETKRALWLSLVLPGAGQIYNRKYWKLPIIYGGFVGCAYALRWNNMMYKDYSQAYMDLMDDDPNTQSYNKFLYLGNQIDSSNKEYYQKLFKNRKDRYRKWRDMSVFAMVGVYLISVVDAYVDASLSEFDISKDLSMKVSPAVIKEKREWASYNPVNSSAIGLQCSLIF